MSQRVWLSGAGGLVGSAVLQALKKRRIDCSASLHKDVDISSEKSVHAWLREKGPFTHVINCAALAKVDDAEMKPKEAQKTNEEGPAIIGRVAAENKLRVVHLSTDYVFDGEGDRPFAETDRTNPISIYGKTKLQGEKNLQTALPSACIVRTSWVFGPGGKNFVNSVIGSLREKKEVRAVDDQIGRPTYSIDLAEALIDLLDASGIFHFANSGAVSRYAFALAIREELNALDVPIARISSKEFFTAAKRPPFSVLSTEKVEHKLHRKIRSWQDALREYLS